MSAQQTEEDMQEDLWDALAEAQRSDAVLAANVKRHGAGRVEGLPIIDPPTVLSRNQLIREDHPYYIAAGFLKLFPLGYGDYWAHVQDRAENLSPLSFWEWLKHLLLRSDGRFQSHPRFYFFALNTALRNKALRARTYFVKKQVGLNTSDSYTNEQLMNMGKAQFAKVIAAFEQAMIGSAQEKLQQRSDLEALVEQIEQETLEQKAQEVLSLWHATKKAGKEELEEGSAEYANWTDQCAAAQKVLETALEASAFSGDATDQACPDSLSGMTSAFSGDAENEAAVLADDVAFAFSGNAEPKASASSGEAGKNVKFLLKILQKAVDRMKAGGEIPCHFTTLTTAIYHWQDLAQILEKYDRAVTQRRHGRRDPLEPSERKLSRQKLLVLKYPGVVAWFTGYKMELFYKHVLKYADGEGVFEWGAGGIMHLHSINFGSQMPRVDPSQEEWRLPCMESVRTAQEFAEVHEEYLTDWSLSKAEKWFEQDVENAPARWTGSDSPLHSDADSDGSEDMGSLVTEIEKVEPESKRARFMRKSDLGRVSFLTATAADGKNRGLCEIGMDTDAFCQHVLAPDEDFVRVFPTCTSMLYVKDTAGRRKVSALTSGEKKLLQHLDSLLQQKDWHPCQIGPEVKRILMTNNCQIVRRMRRKFYRRLSEKCNMHDRHGGVGLEVPPIFVEMPLEQTAGDQREMHIETNHEVAEISVGNLNLHMQPLRADVREMISEHDAFCLQEVTPVTLSSILTAGREMGYDVVSPAQRGHTMLEGFDVCILLRKTTLKRLRVGIVPLSARGIRHMLHVQVQVKKNGACLALATAHCTASKEERSQRTAELEVIWGALEALTVDGCIFAGDTNMHAEESIALTHQEHWDDAWEVDGADAALSGTWCQEWMDPTHASVETWRFDRLWFQAKVFHRNVLEPRDACVTESPTESSSMDTAVTFLSGKGRKSEGDTAVTFLSGKQRKLEGDTAVTFLSGKQRKLEGDTAVTFLSGKQRKLEEDTDVTFLSGKQRKLEGDAGHGGTQKQRMVRSQSLRLVKNSFQRTWGVGLSDHACISGFFLVEAGAVQGQLPEAEYLHVVRPGLGTKVARRPKEGESCAHKTQSLPFCSKDYEKARMAPGRAAILEDSRRKGLYRLYPRRNCHHVNTHDPLKAIGLVANVDDQVVLTIQAAINYLTKYMGKLGTGHTATSRIGGLLDDILCRMQDHETMTVTSLLSKLFIHTAVPDQICSLEAWHILHDFPRVLSSRFFVNLNAKEQPVLKQLEAIQTGTEETTVTRQTKADIYARRLENNVFGENLTADKVRKMSWVQFVARVDRRGRKFSFRKKHAIVKEKPYLNLDSRRPNAGDMARYALRLHRSFASAAEDPMSLSDKVAIEQLHAFIESSLCPIWLKQRYRRQNKVKKIKKTHESSSDMARPAVDLDGKEQVDVAFLPVDVRNQHGQEQVDVAFLSVDVRNNEQEGSKAGGVSAVSSKVSKSKKHVRLEDNAGNRTVVAERHGFPWVAAQGEMRYSVHEACAAKKPTPKRLQMEKYLEAILGEKPKKAGSAIDMMQKFVFHMLVFDLASYSKKGNGLAKEGLSKSALQQLCEAHFQYLGSQKPSQKEQKNVKMKPYPELWEDIKDRTLRECGLSIGHGAASRIALDVGGDVTSHLKDGQWRNAVYCPHPWRQEEEELEDPRERLAKRARYVAGATQEQSMGRPGYNSLHEVLLPLDADALLCVDKETRSEWDALNPFLCSLTEKAISSDLTPMILPETHVRTLRTIQGGLSHEDALAFVMEPRESVSGGAAVTFLSGTQGQASAGAEVHSATAVTFLSGRQAEAAARTESHSETAVTFLSGTQAPASAGAESQSETAVTFLSGNDSTNAVRAGPKADPTQQSFVDHMCAWADAYLSLPDVCNNNLPLPAEKGGAWQLQDSVLLLGTAGTGKTTTVQAANKELEDRGLKGRIVRAAYTGVAASNMGSGARTIMSLFRLKTGRGFGPLQPLGPEEMQSMATLGDLAVLEIDEASMIEKVVLARIHLRLQRWRFTCYHPKHCYRSEPCRCGARLPFGGVKVLLAGDFGQLPPVAVKDDRTLLHGTGCTGTDSTEVNLGSRLFRNVNNVFRLRRIHRQAGASQYKESLLRLRDAAHTKEDVALWKSHDLTSPECTLSAEEIRVFQRDRVHLFCEKQRTGAFNGRRLGEDGTAVRSGGILRVWSVESSPLVERYSCDSFGGLRRVLHFSMGAPVMLISNLRTVWNLVNGLRGRIVGVVWEEEEEETKATETGLVFSDGPAPSTGHVFSDGPADSTGHVFSDGPAPSTGHVFSDGPAASTGHVFSDGPAAATGHVFSDGPAASTGHVFSDCPAATSGHVSKKQRKRNAAEVGGVQASALKYLIIDFPGYVGPCMLEGHPTYVCIRAQQIRHERMPALSRTQFPVVLSYGMTVHKSQGLTLKEGYMCLTWNTNRRGNLFAPFADWPL